MKKYYIGLIVLALVVFGLVGYTLYQGNVAKQDKKTGETAARIGNDLNKYVSRENKIPASLAAAGIKNVPKEVTYKKLSDEKYKFCVTYRAALRGYGVSPTTLAMNAFYSRMYNISDSGFPYDQYESAELYVDTYMHPKGETCSTVKPVFSTYNSSNFDQYCDPNYAYYSYWKDFCATQNNGTTLDYQVN